MEKSEPMLCDDCICKDNKLAMKPNEIIKKKEKERENKSTIKSTKIIILNYCVIYINERMSLASTI